MSAGPYTSCPFAENVFGASANNYQTNAACKNTVNVYSPVTNRSYMNCVTNGVTVDCTDGNKHSSPSRCKSRQRHISVFSTNSLPHRPPS